MLIRHLPDDTIYRGKNNALNGLALVVANGFAWASFSGKNMYKEPDWPESLGDHTFMAYVEDHGEPGAGGASYSLSIP